MSEYKAPIRDMLFVLKELAGLDDVAKLPGCEDVNAELVEQILEENGRFAAEVLSPLFGGYGLAEDSRISELRAYANLFDIGEGAPQVQKIMIGQHALGLRNADTPP